MWSYASTLFLAGAGMIILPFILHFWSDETNGIWQIFQTITTLVLLLDFGFRPSFARNVSYIFSGVKHLQKEGVAADTDTGKVDYSLLKSTLLAMRSFYRWIAFGAFILLASAGTAYIYFEVLGKYSGSHTDVIVAWIMLISINCYNLYTLYYETLLLGKGYVKRSQQITIIGQCAYLLTAIGLIYAGLGLTAVVSAQLISIVIRRVLSYKVFFTPEIKRHLKEAELQPQKDILNAIYPNAVKTGLTHLGGFCVNQSAIFFGTHYLSLAELGSYSITHKIILFLAICGAVVYQTYVPQLAKYRVEKNISGLRRKYTYSVLSLVTIMTTGGLALIFFGMRVFRLIGSQTELLPATLMATMLVIQFLEQNHVIAAGFIMADNKIPFFIPSLVSGAATIILLYLFVGVADMGVWGMILAPGIAQLAYQNWKWPSVVIKEFVANETETQRITMQQ